MLEAVSEDTRSIRLKIVEVAAAQADAGAHYLTGCFGAVPGGIDNVRRRRLDLGEHPEWGNLAVHAAEHTNLPRPEALRCAGRFERARGQSISGDAALERRVREYLEANSAMPADRWPSFEGMGFPRKAWDEFRENYFWVLGEDCRNKAHFDCIGFVNWVLTQIKRSPVTYSSTQWATEGVAPVTVEEGAPVERNLEPGDILVRSTGRIPHMVLVGENAELIEAAGIRVGVVKSPFDATRFGFHSRIRNRWLRGIAP
ncbi:MAG: hypothetical protein U5J83_04600 [Bryobacterales bacterium]|nr:hypothetical protein [Bryobacterales bacterium]